MASDPRLFSDSLGPFVRDTPVVVLAVSLGIVKRTFPSGLRAWFTEVCGDQFAFAHIDLDFVRPGQVERLLRPAHPKVDENRLSAVGFYLFLDGTAVKYTFGVDSRAQKLELMSMVGKRKRRDHDWHHARAIRRCFETVVREFMAARAGSARPRVIIAELTFEQACRLFDVKGDEPDLEKICTKKWASNHPDRLVGVDPEVVRYAEERFKALGRALEAIKKRKRSA